MKPLLMIEDELELRLAVCEALQFHGFEVLEGSTIADARRLAPQAELLLLDLGLPDGDGLCLCQELAPQLPVLVLSARGDETDRVVALELGADDYLAKPFSTRELVARCRSVLRRGHGTDRRQAPVVVGRVTVDIDGRQAWRDGELLGLTTKEIELLACLARHPGRPISRQALAHEVWGTSLGFVTRSLDVHICSLRRKLGLADGCPGSVATVHGYGYRLQP